MRPVRHKYRAQRAERDGQRFDSKLEARYFDKIRLAQRSGKLLFFLRQVPFHLPGGVVYRCDFVEFWDDGDVKFVDCKGVKTPQYVQKKRQVEALYPVTIEEVTAQDLR